MSALPSYPRPPDPLAPPPLKTRWRRRLGRLLAAPWSRGWLGTGARYGSQSGRPQRLLLIRPDHLGDLIFLGPALRWLRTEAPAAHLTLAIGPWGQPALPALAGAYDDLIIFPFPGFERGERAGVWSRWAGLGRLAGQLRPLSFDAALILRPDHWWGSMAAWLAGIQQRAGFATPETTPWLTTALSLPRQHAAANNLQLAAAWLARPVLIDPVQHPLRFALDERDRQAVRQLLVDAGLAPDRRLAAIHPGAGAAVKQWEPARWGQVAQALAGEGLAVVVTGGSGEEALAAEVTAASQGAAINLAGRTSFGQLAALLAQASLALGPDSGPLNLAVAVGAPTVHLFGPADPALFGPWGDPSRHLVLRSDWICVPCGRLDWPDLPAHGCVRAITVEQVLAAAERLFANVAAMPSIDD